MNALSVSLSNALTAAAAGDPALPALSECVRRALRGYLQGAGADVAGGLYQLVLDEVEAPLLREVLRHTDGNLSRAAELLGISRATLRKKLAAHAIGG
jgi:Fis family transcriptional regulator